MKTTEATTTTEAVAVAEQGAQGPDSRQACQHEGARAEKGSQGEESCQARCRKKNQLAPRREQGREDHRDDRTPQGRNPRRDHEGNRLAGTQRARLH